MLSRGKCDFARKSVVDLIYKANITSKPQAHTCTPTVLYCECTPQSHTPNTSSATHYQCSMTPHLHEFEWGAAQT